MKWAALLLSIYIGLRAAPTAAEDPTVKRLHVMVSSLTERMDPAAAWHYLHFVEMAPTVRTLVKLDANGRVVSDLARRWEVSADGMVYDFFLDERAVFCDGSPVKASDVATNIARHLWPITASSLGGYLRAVVDGTSNLVPGDLPPGVRALSAGHLRIVLRQPYIPLLKLLSLTGFGVVRPDTFADSPPCGTGPMLPIRDDSTNIWRLRRNPLYVGPPATWDLIILEHGTPSDVAEHIQSGVADLALGYSETELEQTTVPSSYVFEGLSNFGTLHLYFNNDRDIFRDVGFRRDLAALIRTAAMRESKAGLFVEPIEQLLPEGMLPIHNCQATSLDPIDPSVFRRRWMGQLGRRTLQLLWRREYLAADILDHVINALVEAGVTMTSKTMTIAEMIPEVKGGRYDMALLGYFSVLPDPDGQLDPFRSDTSGLRYGNIPSRDFFAEIETVRGLTSPRERLTGYASALSRFEQQYYVVPLYRLRFPTLHRIDLMLPDTHYRFALSLDALQWRTSSTQERGPYAASDGH